MNDGTEANPLSGIRPYRRRSAMYRWLREHHEQVAELLETIEPSWREVAERLGREGVRNTKGALPSADSARRVWHVVCRDVEIAKTRPGRHGRLPPSRMPADARPPVAATVATVRSAPPAEESWASSPAAPWRTPEGEAPSPPTTSGRGAEMLARVKQTLARSGNDKPKGS